MTADDVHVLTGAYVCDALDDARRRAFERHLGRCEPCAQEVAELRATSTRLADAVAMPPPAELRDRVRRDIAGVRQLPPRSKGPDLVAWPHRRRATRWVSWAAAAALLAGVAILGSVVVNQRDEMDHMHRGDAAVARFLTGGDVRTTVGRLRSGGTVMVASSRRDDALMLTGSGLSRLPGSMTYQVWMMGPTGVRPGPLMRPDSLGVVGPVMAHHLGDADHVTITVEPAGGTSRPTSAPVLMMTLGS